MNYKALHIVLNKQEEADIVMALLGRFPFVGFEEKELSVIGYLEEDKIPEEEAWLEILSGMEYRIEEVESQNWNVLWESNYASVRLDDFCGIRAGFHPPFEKVKYEIIINPRMSFGTGHHATTKTMMRLMKDIPVEGKKVLDFGTGTGVLAILADKMGAISVVAIDNDLEVTKNAAQNIAENQASRVKVYCDDHPNVTDGKFEVILANINRNIILENADVLRKKAAPKGKILVSGILEKDKNRILDNFGKAGWKPEKILQEEEWMGILLGKSF